MKKSLQTSVDSTVVCRLLFSSSEELITIMFKEFIPTNGKNKANVKLMNLKMKSSVEDHISYFQDLVSISQTPNSEFYRYFFMSLPSS